MTRLNVKLIVILAISLVVLTTGVVVVHGIQMRSSVDSLLKRAENAKEENPQTALRLYQLYRNYKPDDTEHYADFAMFAADVALKPGASGRDIGVAIRELEQILRGNVPEAREPELRRKLVELDMNVGRFADAKEHLLTLKKKGEGDADTDLRLARCQASTGRYSEAAELLFSQIGYDPKSKKFDVAKASAPAELKAYTLLVPILKDRLIDSQMTDRKEVADRVIAQMIAANPKSAKAYLAQAEFAQNAEVQKSAIAKAMELAPDDPDVLAQAIAVALTEKDYDEAEELASKATKVAPKDERFYRYQVLISDMQRKPEEGSERLNAALKVLPDNPGLLAMQFERQVQNKDLDGAKVTLKQLTAAKIIPAYRGFLEAKLLVAEGQYQVASQKLKNLRPQLSKFPQLVAQANVLLLDCYNALGQNDQRDQIAEQLPGTIPAQIVNADRLAKSGKYREALNIYEALAGALEKQNQLAAVPQVASAALQMRIAIQLSKPKEDRDWQQVDAWFDKMRDLSVLKAPDDSLVEAEILIHKEQQDQAASLLSSLQKKYPDNPKIAGMQTALLLKRGKRDEVQDYIKNAPAELRDSPALIGAEIESQFEEGRSPDEVKSSLTKISGKVDKLPADIQSRAHIALGVAYLRINDRASADLEWKKAADLQPHDAKIRWLMFDIARQSGDLAAMETLQSWFAKELGREDAQSNLAEAAFITARVREGLKKKYADQPDQLTLSDQDRQNLNKAKDLLREVNNSRPGWVEQPRLLAEINVLENRYEEAIANLQEVVNAGQPSSQTLKQLVSLLHFRKRDADVRELMDKYASLLSGQDMDDLRIQADLLGGNKDEAIKKFESQYDKNSDNALVHFNAGRVFSTAGKGEQAEAAFRKVIELQPTLPDGWLALITQLAMNKKNDEALKVVQEAQIKLPEDARNAVLAQGYEVVGDQAQAEHYYLAALEAAPDSTTAQRSVATYYLRTNRREDAEKQLEKLISSKADSPADRESVAWGRRATAQLWATEGNYQKFLKALELLTPQGRKPSAEDVSMRISLLADRTDLASTRQALRALDELKQIRALSVQERVTAARLNERLGEWFKARDEMNAVLALPKPDTGARLTYAEMLLRRGELDEAESQLRAIKEIESQYAPQMALLTAKILSARGRGADAGNMLANLLPKERPLPSPQIPLLNAISSALEEIKQYEQAEKFLREYVAYEPGQMPRLAEFLARRGKVDAALDLAEGYRNAFPTVQLLGVGMTALHQNVVPPTTQQIARVEQWIQQAQREDDSYQVQLSLADLRDFQKNYAETEKIYRGILNRSGVPAQSRAEVMNNLAFLLAMQGRDLDEALKLINDAVAIYGPQSDMLDTRGVVNLIKGDSKQAVADLSDAVIATDPKPIKYVHLAMAQAAAKDLAGARKSLEKAKALKFTRDDLSPLEKPKFEELLKQLNMTA